VGDAAPTARTETTATAADASTIPETEWSSRKDQRVVVVRQGGAETRGKLISAEGDHAVVMGDDGKVVSIPKREVTAVKSDDSKPADDKAAKPGKKEPDWKYKKLGLFTSHGVGYARWRTPGYRDGHAAYLLDIGVGYNFSERFGVYGLIGGAVGARLQDKTVVGHQGHFALSFLARRKYIAFLPGIGLAMGNRRGPGDLRTREMGVTFPIKLMGVIPLPKDLFLGIGLSYEIAIMGATRPWQAIGGQFTVGRW
jgi:hypothetical protein